MGLFSSSKSSSTQTVTNIDERFAASENSTATRVNSSSIESLTIGSDEVASLAIQSQKEGLALATDLIREAITKSFASSDNRAAAAENNLKAAQIATQEILQRGQESADDRLIKVFAIIAASVISGLYIFRRK